MSLLEEELDDEDEDEDELKPATTRYNEGAPADLTV